MNETSSLKRVPGETRGAAGLGKANRPLRVGRSGCGEDQPADHEDERRQPEARSPRPGRARSRSRSRRSRKRSRRAQACRGRAPDVVGDAAAATRGCYFAARRAISRDLSCFGEDNGIPARRGPYSRRRRRAAHPARATGHLARRGLRRRHCRHGRGGARSAAVRPPKAVILDLVLPDRHGLDVCRELRAWTEVPILVLSAVGDEREKVAALDAGADDYVTKPFGIGRAAGAAEGRPPQDGARDRADLRDRRARRRPRQAGRSRSPASPSR